MCPSSPTTQSDAGRGAGAARGAAFTFSLVHLAHGRCSGLQAVLAFWQPLQARSIPQGEQSPEESVESGTTTGNSGGCTGASDAPTAICTASFSSSSGSRPQELGMPAAIPPSDSKLPILSDGVGGRHGASSSSSWSGDDGMDSSHPERGDRSPIDMARGSWAPTISGAPAFIVLEPASPRPGLAPPS